MDSLIIGDKKMKKIIAMAMLLASAATTYAQDNVEASIGADVVSQYIWRGQDCGGASLQPSLGLSYKGLSLSAWGSVGVASSNDTKEFDLTLAYTIGGFNIGITDYWFNSADKYFYYKSDGGHTFEANIGYDFGPVALQWYTNFAGADGINGSGDRAYSSYVEISAPFRLGGLDWSAAIGAVPFKTDYYADADGFAVTNISLQATKELVITPTFSIPVFAGISANPSTEKAYFVMGFSLGI